MVYPGSWILHINVFEFMAQRLKRLPARQETWVQSLVGKIPWRRKWQPTPVFLPGESHGRRSLVGYSPRGCKELDTAEQLHFTSLHFKYSWPLNNKGLNCSGSLMHGFVPVINTTVLYYLKLVKSVDAEPCIYAGLTIKL